MNVIDIPCAITKYNIEEFNKCYKQETDYIYQQENINTTEYNNT